ncbi:MAG: hypothetical protein OXG58_07175 [Gemmatimonadetes bacterium]|nr:hypothetical protein [Gemmatimonadota bacterium]MCY3943906.1 hypothetical protein [Gemmatimonadota bacterium]
MGADTDHREAVRRAVTDCAEGALHERAEALLAVLGYRSERRIDVETVPADFLDVAEADSDHFLTDKQRDRILQTWEHVAMVHQFTEDELEEFAQKDLFGASAAWHPSRAESFVFLAVDLRSADYTRASLATMTRTINRLFPMPVIVFYRHERPESGVALTLAVVHRRPHKRHPGRDVLEKITLIKDVRVAQPHRAHLDILGELALTRLDLDRLSFDDLHVAWERVLDTEELNRSFYASLFKWYQRAIKEATFPAAAPVEHQVLRLITRVLFVWFVKEKRLVAEDWFRRSAVADLLCDFGGSDYYRAVLQNLFFAALNTPLDQRGFSTQRRTTHRVFSRYRYRSLIQDVGRFRQMMARTPFVNGGLFDCLDDEESRGAGGERYDMFSDPDPAGGARGCPSPGGCLARARRPGPAVLRRSWPLPAPESLQVHGRGEHAGRNGGGVGS